MLFSHHLSSLNLFALTVPILPLPHVFAVAIASAQQPFTVPGQQCHHIVSNKGELKKPDETPQAEQNKNACRRFFSNEYLRSQNADKNKPVEKKVSDTLKGIANNCMYVETLSCRAEEAVKDGPKDEDPRTAYYNFGNLKEYWQDWIPKYYVAAEKANLPYFQLNCFENTNHLPLLGDATALRSKFSTTCAPTHLDRLGNVAVNSCKSIISKGTAKSEVWAPKKIYSETYSNGKGKDDPRFNGHQMLYTEAWEVVKDILDGSSCWFRENVVPQIIAEYCNRNGKAGGIFRFGALINESKFSCPTETSWFRYHVLAKGCKPGVNSNWKAIWVGDIRVSSI